MLPKTKLKPLKKTKILVFLFFLALCIKSASGNKISRLYNKADEYYSVQKYEQALKLYNKINSVAGFEARACQQAARCAHNLEQYSTSDQYYVQLFYKSKEVEPVLFLEYAGLLMKLGRQDEARSYFTSYNNLMENNDPRVLRYIKSIEYYDKYFIDSAYTNIYIINASTEGNDLNPVLYAGKLIYESNASYLKSSPRFSDLCVMEPASDLAINPGKIEGHSASKTEMAGFTIAYETGEIIQSLRSENRDGNYILHRAFIEDEGNKISKSELLDIQNFDGNACYPALSSDGSILIFASDIIPEEGWNLYITHRNAYGYDEPKSIPGLINTLGDESNPYMLNDSILIFTSDGHGGLGGFDLLYINLRQPSAVPRNFGYPLNSQFDEFGFALAENGLTGFLASNRQQQNTLSDLYHFEFIQIRAWGVVTDRQSGENLKNVAIDITRKGEEKSQFTLADNGRFAITGNPGDEYILKVWKEGYQMEEFSASITPSSAGLYEIDLGRLTIEKLNQPSEPSAVEEKIIISEEVTALEAPKTTYVKEEKPLKAEYATIFRLQIAASRKPLSEQEIKAKYNGNRDVFVFNEDSWYKYAIGEYNSFYQANEARKKCGVSDAFIAAYSEGNKIELMQAIKQAYISLQTEDDSFFDPNKKIVQRVEIYFPTDGFQPLPGENIKLEQIVELLICDSQLKIKINGYADKRGSSVYNIGLATERARQLKSLLVSEEIAEYRIRINSYGENKLKVPCIKNCISAIHQENRRAVIIVYK